ncbi:MAG: hypothetical protein ACTSRA_06085, partial [Promethearchaeota archaeon]
VLIDLLFNHGLDHTVDLLRDLVKKRQVEIVGSAKYHPILPLIPKNEVKRQVKLHEEDVITLFPTFEKRGFFPPEMAISPSLVTMIQKLGYKWILASGIACSSDWPYDKIYRGPNNILLFFRDDIISNEISFKKISVDFFLVKLKVLYNTRHYIITAQDGETFGHHISKYEKTFLKRAMLGAIDDPEIEICWISELPDYFNIDGVIRPIASSWSTTITDLELNIPFPLWNHPDNEVHRVQFKFLKNVLEIIYLLESIQNVQYTPEKDTARHFLDEGLHSCQFWWASAHPMWSPNLILKGAELLLRAAFNARIAIIDHCTDDNILTESEELFEQISNYYALLLMEIMRMERNISGKKNLGNSILDNLFSNIDSQGD